MVFKGSFSNVYKGTGRQTLRRERKSTFTLESTPEPQPFFSSSSNKKEGTKFRTFNLFETRLFEFIVLLLQIPPLQSKFYNFLQCQRSQYYRNFNLPYYFPTIRSKK